jgi:hypothetical protein
VRSSAPTLQLGVNDVQQVALASGTQLDIPKPPATKNGDLLFGCTLFRNSGVGATPGTGFTALGINSMDNGIMEVWQKPITDVASEPALYSFITPNGANRCGGFIARVTGANNASPQDAVGTASVSASALGLTTVRNYALLLYVVQVNVAAATPLTVVPPASMALGVSVPIAAASSTTLAVATELRPTAGATGARLATFSGGTVGSIRSYMLAIRAA